MATTARRLDCNKGGQKALLQPPRKGVLRIRGKRATPQEQKALQDASANGSGCPTPQSVVDVARDPKSALHKYFEWDDKIAGDLYRLDQARSLLQSVTIWYSNTKSATVITAKFFNRDPRLPGHTQGYISVEVLQRDSKSARAVLVNAVNQAAALLRNARGVATVVGLRAELDSLIDEMAGLVKSASASHPSPD